MRAILEFNLPDDNEELDAALNAIEWKHRIEEIRDTVCAWRCGKPEPPFPGRELETEVIEMEAVLQACDDITSRLGNPIWWDEAGCPRYEQFCPTMANDIYAREVALLRIRCQSCGTECLVCISAGLRDSRPLNERPQPLPYGDPPGDCCQQGSSMTSETLEVMQLWVRQNSNWVQKSPAEFLPSTRSPRSTQS